MSTRPAWQLRGALDGGKRVWTVPISQIPFRVGRRPGLDLTLPATSVSTEHAEFYALGDALHLRDLASTNGTFVNRQRIVEQILRTGDILHFADFEFRLECRTGKTPNDPPTVNLGDPPLPEQFVLGTRELEELLRTKAVTNLYQSIVTLRESELVGYEALGRGRHPGLPDDPTSLLRIAASLGVADELSRLFRRESIDSVGGLAPKLRRLFLNTYPTELVQRELADSLVELRELAPDLPLTLEVHEAAVVNSESIREFRQRLSALGISLAYDDFGSGQARLLELAEVPPDYLKFDIRFVKGISNGPDSKVRLVRSLVAVARELGVLTLAEGIETEADGRVCTELGFDMAQGFFYSLPVPVAELPP